MQSRHVEKIAREADRQCAGSRHRGERELLTGKIRRSRQLGRHDHRAGLVRVRPIGDAAAALEQFDGKHLQFTIKGTGHRRH
jgi:hypothetical protein